MYGLDDIDSAQRQTVAGLLAMPLRSPRLSRAARGACRWQRRMKPVLATLTATRYGIPLAGSVNNSL
jgi:hypothetical protein